MERIRIDRKPLAEGASSVSGKAFRDCLIEVFECSEELALSRETRVIEEIVLYQNGTSHVVRPSPPAAPPISITPAPGPSRTLPRGVSTHAITAAYRSLRSWVVGHYSR